MLAEIRNNASITGRVIGAVMLRDMRTRLSGTRFGYLFAVLVPFVHIFALVMVYTFLGRQAPIGTDPVIFFAMGILPFMLLLYPMGQITRALVSNRALLHFPRVRPTDIIAARVLLEALNGCNVCAIVLLGLVVLGHEFEPQDFARLFGGLALAFGVGAGFGVVFALLGAMWQPILLFSMIMRLGFYLTSGIFFLPGTLPKQVRDILWFNPLVHPIELVREAYYADYTSNILAVSYPVGFIVVCLLLALVIEYFVRNLLVYR